MAKFPGVAYCTLTRSWYSKRPAEVVSSVWGFPGFAVSGHSSPRAPPQWRVGSVGETSLALSSSLSLSFALLLTYCPAGVCRCLRSRWRPGSTGPGPRGTRSSGLRALSWLTLTLWVHPRASSSKGELALRRRRWTYRWYPEGMWSGTNEHLLGSHRIVTADLKQIIQLQMTLTTLFRSVNGSWDPGSFDGYRSLVYTLNRKRGLWCRFIYAVSSN